MSVHNSDDTEMQDSLKYRSSSAQLMFILKNTAFGGSKSDSRRSDCSKAFWAEQQNRSGWARNENNERAGEVQKR